MKQILLWIFLIFPCFTWFSWELSPHKAFLPRTFHTLLLPHVYKYAPPLQEPTEVKKLILQNTSSASSKSKLSGYSDKKRAPPIHRKRKRLLFDVPCHSFSHQKFFLDFFQITSLPLTQKSISWAQTWALLAQRRGARDPMSPSPQVRLLLYKLLEDTLDVLNGAGIPYWVGRRSLLGAMLYQDMLPTARNITLMIEDTYRDAYISLENSLCCRGIYQQYFFLYTYHLKRSGKNFCDPYAVIIIFMTKTADGLYREKNNHRERRSPPMCFRKEDLFPLKKRFFGPYTVYVPQSPMPALDETYPNWRFILAAHKPTYERYFLPNPSSYYLEEDGFILS